MTPSIARLFSVGDARYTTGMIWTAKTTGRTRTKIRNRRHRTVFFKLNAKEYCSLHGLSCAYHQPVQEFKVHINQCKSVNSGLLSSQSAHQPVQACELRTALQSKCTSTSTRVQSAHQPVQECELQTAIQSKCTSTSTRV